MTTSDRFPPRKLGDYTLVAQLNEDALGTVYRALHGSDQGRFVRLRVLQSPELAPEAVAEAIRKRGRAVSALSHKTVALREELALIEDVPCLTWYESGGWTLDFLLSRLRAEKRRTSSAHALLIAQRVSAALEHAWFTVVDGEPMRHGLVWPGFVSVSIDAEIRLGGFGLADAVLPSLHKPRLTRDVAPYLPPEARTVGVCGENSDVYSIGAILLELLTGARPPLESTSADPPEAELPSSAVADFLGRCFAPPAERFSNAVELNRALQELLASGAEPVSSAELALFLYGLLNPESRRAAPALDADSTNPVAEKPAAGPAPENASALRGRSPRVELEAARTPRASSAPWIAKWKSDRLSVRILPMVRIAAAALGTLTAAALLLVSTRRPDRGARADAVHAPLEARVSHAGAAIGSARERAVSSSSSRPEGFSSASEPVTTHRRSGSGAAAPAAVRGRARADALSSAALAASAGQSRSAAESSRLQAGLARVHAEGLEARQLASEAFAEARELEESAESLLRGGDYAAARGAFDRAADRFRDAETHSREERVRRIRLAD